jgi:RNA polymerase sigma-70 factor (ECF subfamily)
MTKNTDDAKELLSETLYQAFLGFAKLKSEEAFLSYVFTIASRVFYKSIKYQSNFEKDFDFDNLMDKTLHPDIMLDIKILHQAMNMLNADYKETLILSEIEGFSRKEVSLIMNVSEETVKSRLYRAKKQLAEIIGVKDEYRIK